ncbi:DUF3293 domain-containing protein [Shewanella maritima]|uniref:DUF3293 domain-containing protein n=1 Tax=Shewanella maritima TaxID=2520507 RepID=UPI0037364114
MNIVNQSLWQHYQSTQFLLTQRLSNHFSFAIITAHNPQGDKLTSCQNRLLDKQLLRTIMQLKRPYRALVGAAPDLSHMEKSWAVFIEKEQALDLGRQFKQHAIYYVDRGKLFLIGCAQPDAQEVEMGQFDQRLSIVNELPDLIDD